MDIQEKFTGDDFDDAYRIAAQIFKKYGDKYLPIFERMHHEREKRRVTNELKCLAFQVAEESVK